MMRRQESIKITPYNPSKVRIKEIQNINDTLINNQGNHQ